MKTTDEEKQEAIKHLKKLVKPYGVVYTDLKNVSSSGMSRRLKIFVIKKNEPIDITYLVSQATRYKVNDDYELKVSGCGMNMGFAVIYDLSSVLYPKGFKIKGGYGRNGETNQKWDDDGGYALKQKWI